VWPVRVAVHRRLRHRMRDAGEPESGSPASGTLWFSA